MNKLMIGVVGGALMLTAGVAVARPMHAAQGPQIWEQAHVPLANGMEAIAVVKNGNKERTVACRDTADVPQRSVPKSSPSRPPTPRRASP